MKRDKIIIFKNLIVGSKEQGGRLPKEWKIPSQEEPAPSTDYWNWDDQNYDRIGPYEPDKPSVGPEEDGWPCCAEFRSISNKKIEINNSNKQERRWININTQFNQKSFPYDHSTQDLSKYLGGKERGGVGKGGGGCIGGNSEACYGSGSGFGGGGGVGNEGGCGNATCGGVGNEGGCENAGGGGGGGGGGQCGCSCGM